PSAPAPVPPVPAPEPPPWPAPPEMTDAPALPDAPCRRPSLNVLPPFDEHPKARMPAPMPRQPVMTRPKFMARLHSAAANREIEGSRPRRPFRSRTNELRPSNSVTLQIGSQLKRGDPIDHPWSTFASKYFGYTARGGAAAEYRDCANCRGRSIGF